MNSGSKKLQQHRARSQSVDRALTVLLRGEFVAFPPDTSSQAVLERIEYHGIAALLYQSGALTKAALELHGALRGETLGRAAEEAVNAEVLRDLCESFASVDVQPLFLKGAALAYSIYSDATLRPRCDSDILVPEVARDRSEIALRSLGFEALASFGPGFQRSYRVVRHGVPVTVDLHWRPSNSEVLNRAFLPERLWANCRPLPRLHPNARALDPIESLAFGIAHQAHDTTRGDAWRLIWLHDLFLIGTQLTEDEWRRVCSLVEELGMAETTADVLTATEAAFGRVAPSDLLDALRRGQSGQLDRFLAASDGARILREVTCRSISDALRYLARLAMPPRARLDAMYGPMPRWNVPFLYVRRAVIGIRKAFGAGARWTG